MSIFDWLCTRSQRQAVERFMVKLVNQKQLLERTKRSDRQEGRTSASFEMRVLSWNGSQLERDSEFFTTTRDINLRGLSFVSPVPFAPGERLAVSIFVEEESHHMLAEVRHDTSLGPSTILIGCEIIGPLASTPELQINLATRTATTSEN